jgi:hypothetical protein
MGARGVMRTVALTGETWPVFARLVEAHRGVWGGCWCLGFHAERNAAGDPAERRQMKEDKVRRGAAHAALVLDGEDCVGWAQFGSPAELPTIKNRKAYDAGVQALPDWRVTCFFVANGARRAGVAARALEGALELIAAAGGGVVEGYPEAIEGQKTSAAFLWGGTVGMFTRAGFVAERKIGLHRWVMRSEVTT